MERLGMKMWVGLAVLALFGGCGETETGATTTVEVPGEDTPVPGSLTVTQGGAQDIAIFREIVAGGDVPSPDTLSEVGFFAEHAVDLPLAECGEDLCFHPMLAVAPRFDGGNWTMGFIGMNTPLDPTTLERPAVHLAVAVDVSGGDDAWLAVIEAGLAEIATGLDAGDLLSIVAYATTSDVAVEAAAPSAPLPDLGATARGVSADLYGALATAGRLVDGDAEGRAGRILVLSTGAASAGITDGERIVALAESYARAGIALNVVGFGEPTTAEAELLGDLGDVGAGTFALAEDGDDLAAILTAQGATTLFSIGTDLRLTVAPAPGYRVGRVWGSRRASSDGALAHFDTPALFVGQRTGASDVGGGRRGGGGGLFVELIAEADAESLGAEAPAFSYEASWIGNDGAEHLSQETVDNPLAPGVNPTTMWPAFTGGEKPFMMLNMYLALRTAVDLYAAGDCARARGVEPMMTPSIEVYQARMDDPDIAVDWELLMDLTDIITTRCGEARGVMDPEAQTIIEPIGSGAGCFIF